MEEHSEDENCEPAPKKIKSEWSKSYSNKAVEMMMKMGYENDKGLGKSNQGRLEPIIAVQQDGRRGFGLKLDTVQGSADQWDPNCEELVMPEVVTWISNKANPHDPNDAMFTLEQLIRFIRYGERKTTLEGETHFADPQILHHVLHSKSVFDDLNDNEMRRARSRSNPFETIRSSIFLNRAAVKMANIDAMCDMMFTEPKDQAGSPLVGADELLYFADICAGPGGFSEYILYRKSWEAKGFGFTLRGANDFKLDKFFAASPESFDAYYGVKDDGDVFDEGNQDSFAEYIHRHTPEGVHFVMADGGFSVEGQENMQEILSKQLYVCQCLTALKILRENGSFVCKLFDLFTTFSIGLVYLMYKCFEQISIIKPNSSRPANSERYLVCKWKRADTTSICRYLNTVNNILNENVCNRGNDDSEVIEIVDYDHMLQDEYFIKYIIASNNQIGQNQIFGLRKIAAYCQNKDMKEPRQSEVRKRCLELWRLPDKLRQAPEIKPTEKLLEELLNYWSEDKSWLHTNAEELISLRNLETHIKSVCDWYFVPIGRGETSINACSLFLCRSRGNLLRYTDSKKWEPVECVFEVQPKSLFFGEIVYEFYGEGRTQTRVAALHIIDAICLGGIDIRRLSLCDRVRMCEKYALSVNKPFKERSSGAIRSKPLFQLQAINEFFNQMRHYTLKDNSQRFGYALDASKFFVPGGIMIFCEIFHTYVSAFSRSSGQQYFFNVVTRESYYKDDLPAEKRNEIYASFRNCYTRRLQWKWVNTRQVEEDAVKEDSSILYRSDFLRFLIEKQQHNI